MKKHLILFAICTLIFTGCQKVSEEYIPAEAEITLGESYTAAPETSQTTAATTAETEPVITEKTVSFTALGDNLIHSSIYKQAARRGAESGKDYDFEYAYAGVADLLDTADITVLNQETLICNDMLEPSSYPTFNSPKALGDHMAELGVDVFTIANNHTLDKGTKGLTYCLAYYDENKLMRVGAYRDCADRENIRVMEKNGVKVSFLAYTESLNGLSLPADSPLEIGRTDMDVMKSEIAAAKEISDICVVSLHWGTENSSVVEDYQRTEAKELAEAGADVIIGNHPHVLREIEIFENSDGGNTICAYSLGNFISAQAVGTNLIGGVLDFDVSVDEGREPQISGYTFIPIVTHYDANYSNIRLYKLSDYTPELASAHGVRVNSRFDYDYIIEYLTGKGLYDAVE